MNLKKSIWTLRKVVDNLSDPTGMGYRRQTYSKEEMASLNDAIVILQAILDEENRSKQDEI